MGQPDENTPLTPGTAVTDPPQQRPVNHTPSPQPESQTAPPVQRVRGDDILSAIESIPEKVVAGIREATPGRRQAPQAAGKETPPSTVAQPAQPAPTAAETPARKSFAEWWFGV